MAVEAPPAEVDAVVGWEAAAEAAEAGEEGRVAPERCWRA